MTTLYGKSWDRETLLRYAGHMRQIGGAQRMTLEEGPEHGVRAIEVRTGTGFQFTVLPDRGLDIWRAEYRGMSLCWHSPTGPIAPTFYDAMGLGWLRGFYGGMLVTCGLAHVGPPDEFHGLHGRASYTPAHDVHALEDWEGNEYRIEVRGKIREAAVFGENLLLRRRIRTTLGENRFVLEDEVENAGDRETPHQILYHLNAGFPLLDEGSELLTLSGETRARDEGTRERVVFHKLRRGLVLVANRPRNLGYALRFKTEQLPCFTEWRVTSPGMFVMGTEPGNCFPGEKGTTLKPGEKRRYELEFLLLTSAEEIRRMEEGLK